MNMVCRLTLKAFENIPLKEFKKIVLDLCLEKNLKYLPNFMSKKVGSQMSMYSLLF